MDWENGGGFMNDPVMADDPHQVTTSVSVATGDDAKKTTTTSVSVAQVAKLTRPNDGLTIHGRKVYHINLVACVYEVVEVSNIKIHVLLDDHSGSGPLEVTHIVSDRGMPGEDSNMDAYNDDMADKGADDRRDIHTIKAGDVVRVIGVVKYSQDKANVIAYALKFIEDVNEITMHLMEVLVHSRGAQKAQANGGVYPTAAVANPVQTGANMAQSDMGKVSNEYGKLSTREKHLLTFLKSKANNENGIHVDEICKNFTAFKKQDIIASLNLLSNEGLCWQSDAEDVWCVD